MMESGAGTTVMIPGIGLPVRGLELSNMIPDSRYVHAGEFRTRAICAGDGHDVVLLHGNAGFARDFSGSLPLVARRYRGWILERPGHGESERPTDRMTLDDHVRWLHITLESLSVVRPYLVAHSWSGALALACALSDPGRVAGIVLLAPLVAPISINPLDRLLDSPATKRWLHMGIVTNTARRQVTTSLRKAFFPDPVPEDYLNEALRQWTRPGQLAAIAQDNIAAARALPALTERYRTLQVPVVIVEGDRDQLLASEEHGQYLHRAAPHSRHILLVGAGHEIQHTHPAAVMEALQILERAEW